MRSKRSAAAPESSVRCISALPSSAVLARPERASSSPPSASVTLCEPRVAAPSDEKIDGVADFDGVAGGAGERLVHVGDQRDGRQAGAGRDRRDALGQFARALERRHEGARAGLDVHDQAFEARGELLRQDRGRDQRDQLDRRRHVADRVEAPVGRREGVRLADDGAARLAHDALEREEIGLRDIARDRIELVERAAGVAEAAARDHRHEGAAGGEHRREHERHVVADAAGRMLVEDRARQVRRAPVERFAGERHGAGQRDALVERHAVEEHRHGEGGGLPLGDRAAGQPGDELADLGLGQRRARRAWRG